MRKIGLIIILLYNLGINAQSNKNYEIFFLESKWETPKLINNINIKTFIFTEFKRRKFAGLLTVFNKDNSFKTYFVAPCGNDKRRGIKISGKYYFYEKNKIVFKIKEKEMNFKIKKKKNKFILTRI